MRTVELLIDEEQEDFGVEAISLVKFPAIEENFVPGYIDLIAYVDELEREGAPVEPARIYALRSALAAQGREPEGCPLAAAQAGSTDPAVTATFPDRSVPFGFKAANVTVTCSADVLRIHSS